VQGYYFYKHLQLKDITGSVLEEKSICGRSSMMIYFGYIFIVVVIDCILSVIRRIYRKPQHQSNKPERNSHCKNQQNTESVAFFDTAHHSSNNNL
jgi:hypothetical protein